jgi:hypothetical protein
MKQFRNLGFLAFALAGTALITTACHSEREPFGTKHEEHGEKGGSQATKEHAEKGEEAEEHSKEDKIPFAEAPAAVRGAITKLAPTAKVTEVERATEDGYTTFEVEYTAGADKLTASVSETGEVLEIERAVTVLPDAVKNAIAKAMPGAKVIKSESVQTFMYEVMVEKDGKIQEIKVAPTGEMDEEDED